MILSNIGNNISIHDSAATSHIDKQQDMSLQSYSYKRLCHDWKWREYQLHTQGEVGCHMQAQRWIHGQRDMGCEDSPSVEP